MSGIDHEVGCHQLAIGLAAKAVVQHRRTQSPEKEEAAENAVKDLLEEKFISEARFNTVGELTWVFLHLITIIADSKIRHQLFFYSIRKG